MSDSECQKAMACWGNYCKQMIAGPGCGANSSVSPCQQSCGSASRGSHWTTVFVVGSILLAFVIFFVWPMGMCGYRSVKGSSCDRAQSAYDMEVERQQQQQILQQQRNRALQMQHEEYQRQQTLLQQQIMLQEAAAQSQGCGGGYSASTEEDDSSDPPLPSPVEEACSLACPADQPNCQMTRKQSRSCIRAIMEQAAKNGAITC